MPRLLTRRLAKSIQGKTEKMFYSDQAVLIKQVPTGTFNAYNQAVSNEVEIPLSCNFTDSPNRESWRDFGDIEIIDAEIRFKGSDPAKGDKIKLIGKFDGLDYPPATFEIVGIMNRHLFGWKCALKIVRI